MSDRIRVAGYAQKVVYTDGIEYRNFTPDLVGLQLTSDGGTPLFTMGNFSITTNIDAKLNKTFITNKFSSFLTLSDLKVDLKESKSLLLKNTTPELNLDKTNLKYYALFGSLSEFVRVSLENIITTWPASLYPFPLAQAANGSTINGFTYENYTYNTLTEISEFKINNTFIVNKFDLNILKNGTILNTFNENNSLRNVTVNYAAYSVLVNNIEYPLIGFTGATYNSNDYVYLKVKGNPFSGLPTNNNVAYHIKPSKIKEEAFFNNLLDFEAYLLNRKVTPIYTAAFNYPIKSDNGVIVYITDKVKWPVSDGYNIDFDSEDYTDYATKLLEIATVNDLTSSNLMNRFLVSESISDFDTTPVHLSDLDQDTSGQKMNKTLQIYGVSFDELNNFISGIAFANTVTYNKQDNTPDIYLKNLARVLGWELVSSILENNLLSNYITTKASTYSGQTVGLTPYEADIELWRRLILNTPWLWKSKGARKSIEFLLRFIGTPQGLIKFNEYIYKADAPIDIDIFIKVLELNNLDTDLSVYPIDSDGFPRPLPDSPNMYFQNNGLWYRQTGGSGSTIDILTGNNPHLGPYDGGYKYIRQFEELIPNFSAVTISSITTTTNTENLYTNYDLGTFDEGVSTATTVDTIDITSQDNSDIGDCVIFTPTIEIDPIPSPVINNCGCETPSSDNILSLCVEKNKNTPPETVCDESLVGEPFDDIFGTGMYVFSYYQYNEDGSIYLDESSSPILNESKFTNIECCKSNNGIPFPYDEYENDKLVNSGYVCCNTTGKRCGCIIACKWVNTTSPIFLPELTPTYSGPQEQYLQFIKEDNSLAVVTPDGCNCLNGYTIPVPNILDPYTGEIGFACQLTRDGLSILGDGASDIITNYYNDRASGIRPCFN